VTETGVGDRWLQHALMDDLESEYIVGAEPSGHVILKNEIGSKKGLWGDGIKTMLEFLRLIDTHGENWSEIASSSASLNLTHSIYPSNKALWDPDGESGKLVLDAIVRSLNTDPESVRRVDLEGENSLLLLRYTDEAEWSFAIRNSGTELKTRVTLRTAGGTRDESGRVMTAIIDVLEPLLKSDSTS
jgi:phosphomannomutase